MSAVIDMPIPDEFLTEEEVRILTGCHFAKDQIEWLKKNEWAFSLTRAKRPIVSRWAMRLRLAGVPVQNKPPSKILPDFSKAT